MYNFYTKIKTENSSYMASSVVKCQSCPEVEGQNPAHGILILNCCIIHEVDFLSAKPVQEQIL